MEYHHCSEIHGTLIWEACGRQVKRIREGVGRASMVSSHFPHLEKTTTSESSAVQQRRTHFARKLQMRCGAGNNVSTQEQRRERTTHRNIVGTTPSGRKPRVEAHAVFGPKLWSVGNLPMMQRYDIQKIQHCPGHRSSRMPARECDPSTIVLHHRGAREYLCPAGRAAEERDGLSLSPSPYGPRMGQDPLLHLPCSVF